MPKYKKAHFLIVFSFQKYILANPKIQKNLPSNNIPNQPSPEMYTRYQKQKKIDAISQAEDDAEYERLYNSYDDEDNQSTNPHIARYRRREARAARVAAAAAKTVKISAPKAASVATPSSPTHVPIAPSPSSPAAAEKILLGDKPCMGPKIAYRRQLGTHDQEPSYNEFIKGRKGVVHPSFLGPSEKANLAFKLVRDHYRAKPTSPDAHKKALAKDGERREINMYIDVAVLTGALCGVEDESDLLDSLYENAVGHMALSFIAMGSLDLGICGRGFGGGFARDADEPVRIPILAIGASERYRRLWIKLAPTAYSLWHLKDALHMACEEFYRLWRDNNLFPTSDQVLRLSFGNSSNYRATIRLYEPGFLCPELASYPELQACSIEPKGFGGTVVDRMRREEPWVLHKSESMRCQCPLGAFDTEKTISLVKDILCHVAFYATTPAGQNAMARLELEMPRVIDFGEIRLKEFSRALPCGHLAGCTNEYPMQTQMRNTEYNRGSRSHNIIDWSARLQLEFIVHDVVVKDPVYAIGIRECLQREIEDFCERVANERDKGESCTRDPETKELVGPKPSDFCMLMAFRRVKSGHTAKRFPDGKLEFSTVFQSAGAESKVCIQPNVCDHSEYECTLRFADAIKK